MEDEKSYLTVNEVKDDLGVGRNVIYRIFSRKDFPANRLTRPFSISKEAYENWKLKRHEN